MKDDCSMTVVVCPYEEAGCTFHVSFIIPSKLSGNTESVYNAKSKNNVSTEKWQEQR